MKYLFFYVVASLLFLYEASAITIEIDPLNSEHSLQWAASMAAAGDTILLLQGNHRTGQFISNLHGSDKKPIVIMSKGPQAAIFTGGNQAIHFSYVSYLIIENVEFKEQTGNGVNIDDGGDYDTPTHHIVFKACKWSDMNASGNNDQLKMSGVDNFLISGCSFVDGSSGGSMVDMVGCHNGIFEKNMFKNGGSNSIQAKGGTRYIIIKQNEFIDGGQRAINCGGSTGLPYFRPADANYEAQNISIFSNIFKGSVTPIGFVGCTECEFINNTIYKPSRWIARVLQENTDERFIKCSYNVFANNICYFDNNADHEQGINIGSNTLPETFSFTNNLWFNVDNDNWNGPNTAFNHQASIVNQDPMFKNADIGDFGLIAASPAIGEGIHYDDINTDYFGYDFKNPPSMGAVEYEGAVNSHSWFVGEPSQINIIPNPTTDYIEINNVILNEVKDPVIKIYDVLGIEHPVASRHPSIEGNVRIDVSGLPKGVYFVSVGGKVLKFLKI